VVVPTHKKVDSQTCHRLIRTSHEYERCERLRSINALAYRGA